MKITILKGASSNNVLRRFADDLETAFQNKDISTRMVDLTNEDETELISNNKYLDDANALITFNCLLGDQKNKTTGELLLKNLKIPFIGWLVDDPIYHLNRLRPYIPQRFTLCPSEHHLKFLETEKIHSKNKILLSGTSSKETIYSFKERNIDILIIASFMGDGRSLFLKFKDSYYDLLIKKTLEHISQDKYLRVADALKTQSRRLGYEINFNNSIDLEIASLLHSYQRIIDRNNIIKTICASPYKVTLIGEGWENFLEPCPNVIFLDSMATENADSYIQRSKVVLSINSSNGACERVFNAMSYGCCVLSDNSTTLDLLFKENKDVVFFNKNTMHNINNILGNILESGNGELIASRGYKNVRDNHLWNNRVDSLLSYIN
jgi:spore maturation protein CgeB